MLNQKVCTEYSMHLYPTFNFHILKGFKKWLYTEFWIK